MADKQTIDVTKCIHFDKSDIPNGCACYWDGECNHDCYYKKYIYKEQECERLKHNNDYEVGALEKTIDNLKAENDRLIDELDKLKVELKDITIRKIDYLKKSLIYKQALIEIKEIAEKQCICGVYCIDMKQILQLISEVEL